MESKEIIEMLNKNRANELIAILQYMNHYYRVMGEGYLPLRDLFKNLGLVEMKHAEMLAERISILGGDPISRTEVLKQYTDLGVQEPNTIKDMIMANLDYERRAINDYNEHIKRIGRNDPVSTRMLEDILGQEEGHANDLQAWLGRPEIAFELRAA